MAVLCGAVKAECDKMVEQFKALNEQIRETVQAKASPSRWTPDDAQSKLALETLSQFHKAIDEARFEDAYQMFTPGMQRMMPLDRYVELENQFREKSGGEPVRPHQRVTWYKDPPGASAKGIFAAFNIRCAYRKIVLCEEVIILHDAGEGVFRVMRSERTVMDKDNEQKGRALNANGKPPN
jgi:hypothetical protein